MLAVSSEETLRLDRKIAQGGEGAIFTVVGRPSVVAKIYSTPSSPARIEKLQEMVRHPPPDPTAQFGHNSICWPRSLVIEGNGCIGFLMPRIDPNHNKALLHFYNPYSRQEVAPGFTWGHLVHVAANTASVVGSLHAAGYVIGDLNESNFLVSDRALVSLVDCDSMQVPKPGGTGYFRCIVGKLDYCAPELHGCDFTKIDRLPEQDNFALGVLIFQLLMEGVHPFAGVWQGEGDPSHATRIRGGESPYVGSQRVLPPPGALPIAMLPATLKSLVTRCLGAGHGLLKAAARPSAREWRDSLAHLIKHLKQCTRGAQHVYPGHLTRCPWCDRRERLGIDSYPGLGSSR